MDPNYPALVLTRALHVSALCAGFGTLVALRVLVPSPQAREPLRRLASFALAAGLLTLVPWLLLQSAVIADVHNVAQLPDATILVLSQSWFGHVVLARLALLATSLLLCRSGWPGTAVLTAALALITEAAIGHAVNGELSLVAAEALHVLAAGAWLGALPALLVLLRGSDAVVAAQRFSGLGIGAVAVVAGSALALASEQLGGIGGLFGTEYGAVILTKLSLFLGLLVLACVNRLVLTPRLPTTGPGMLRISVMLEIGFGLCMISAAVWLAALMPGAHQQPIWPYAWRPSLVILQYASVAPELVAEPALAMLALIVGWGILGAAMILRRLRLLALMGAAVVSVFAVPALSVFLVPAYPTSFYRSTTGGDPASVAVGRTLFAAHCVACHGAQGKGDGPIARSLEVPPADLTAEHLLEHDDGELFWWLSHGIDRPPGSDGLPRQSMPGFAAALDEQSIWELIDFIRADNPYFATNARNRASHGAPHVHVH